MPRGAPRTLGAIAALVLLLAAGIVLGGRLSRAPSSGSGVPTTPVAPTPEPGTPPAESPGTPPPMDAAAAERILASVDEAAAASAEDLLAAGVIAGRGGWRELGHPAWPMRGERPVYVGAATLTIDTVDADLVVAQRLEQPTDALQMRLLPAAVGDNGLQLTATVDGQPAAAEASPDGILRIELDRRRAAGTAVQVRVELAYDILTTAEAPDDSGPAAYGLLARAEDTTALGHWLPLLTFEPEPVVPWGDVGSFPVAVWSLSIEHPGLLVTGGEETDCPGRDGPGCTWTRGIALRDVSAVLLDDGTTLTTTAAGLAVRSIGPDRIPQAALETALDEAAAAAEGFTRRFGPVAWSQFDVVAVPLGQGAAGVEFPGLVMIDDELYGRLRGGFGTYVVVHEVAHQWFHALVGNGSFADPVVDEPLAQYLSVLAYRDLFGPAAADALVDDSLAGRYERFRVSGLEEEPPAQPSGEFAGPATYGPLVYARAPLGWIAAEELLGEEEVVAFLAGLVTDHGLGTLTAEQVRQAASARDPRFGDILERYWYADEPVPVP